MPETQLVRDIYEDLVSGMVTMNVVDILEVIHIEKFVMILFYRISLS